LNVEKGRTSGRISVYYRDKFSSKITIEEKFLFSFDEDMYFCNVYLPPPNSTVLNHLQVDFVDKLEEGVETYEPLVFINGDFNSRTSNFDDYIELDQYVSDDFENSDDITIGITRVNQNKKIEVFGKTLLSFCKTSTF